MYKRKSATLNQTLPKKFSLNITSMADMFTILLVFLLQSYSTQAFKPETHADLTLPVSATPQQPHKMGQLYVTKDSLILDQTKIGSLQQTAQLTQSLKSLRQMPSPESWVTQGELLIYSDRQHTYSLIKKVMQAARDAGFSQIKLATLTGE